METTKLIVSENPIKRLGYLIGAPGDDRGRHVANVFERDDATLFAAAPDMLAALKLAHECLLEPSESGKPDGYGQSTTATKIRAAIAKAECRS